MSQPEGAITRHHSNAYNIFILVLTVLSLAVMGALLLPLTPQTHDTLRFYDNIICLVFLADFAYNLTGSKPKRAYFIHGRGWLDLLGSIPSVGIFQFGAIFRLARLSRFARILKLLQGKEKAALIKDVVQNRGQYAMFITLLLVMIVLTVSSVLILQFESGEENGNIKSGGDALWWAFVTITTVGYGDRFPVSPMGRITGVAVMFAGIGIIGALASILASLLVAPSSEDTDAAALLEAEKAEAKEAVQVAMVQHQAELEATRAEIAELKDMLIASGLTPPGRDTPT